MDLGSETRKERENNTQRRARDLRQASGVQHNLELRTPGAGQPATNTAGGSKPGRRLRLREKGRGGSTLQSPCWPGMLACQTSCQTSTLAREPSELDRLGDARLDARLLAAVAAAAARPHLLHLPLAPHLRLGKLHPAAGARVGCLWGWVGGRVGMGVWSGGGGGWMGSEW